MRAKPESWEDPIFTGRPDSEYSREDKPSRANSLQTPRSSLQAIAGEATEPSEQPLRWENIIGKIVAFSPDATQPGTRFCGAVVNVSEAPNFGLLPTCIATIRGRTRKTMQIDFTKHYGQIYETWKEAEQYGN